MTAGAALLDLTVVVPGYNGFEQASVVEARLSFLADLHGTVAAVLICTLLFVDEAGLPLPIAPSEGLLLLTGVLVSAGAFPAWVILPAAFLAMASGMITGYGWARTIGQSGLQAIAERVRAGEAYQRAQERLQSASPLEIAFSRVVPGLRPYATLVSGAASVEIRTFLLGAAPALLLWEIVWIAVGMLVGLPVAHFFGQFEKVALRGVILIALGTVGWLAIRDVSADPRNGISGLTPRLRASLALVFDAGIVVSLVGGLFALGRKVMQVSADGWIEVLVAAMLLIAVLLLGRGSQTPGETLFATDYWHRLPATSR
ncbi:MAG: DedA family protein [Chloroflexota bacterium]|nr:MAG: hypothetical protein DLM70_11510 [Chloroflexota bacterium]